MKIAIACVVRNNDQYFLKTEKLVKSIRTLGGNLASSDIFVNYVDGINPAYRTSLEKYGVKIKVVRNFDQRSPHCNKINMLMLTESFDILVALDADTVIVRDFSSFLNNDYLSAKVADGNPLSVAQWRRLFNFFKVPLPTVFMKTHSTAQRVIPYFNSGVLIIPYKYLALLRKNWQFYSKKLLNSYEKLGDLKNKIFFTDQFALSLALAATKIPINPLPLEMNFPTQCFIHPSLSPDSIEPYILHYHHKITPSGLLQHCKYRKPNEAITRVNQLL